MCSDRWATLHGKFVRAQRHKANQDSWGDGSREIPASADVKNAMSLFVEQTSFSDQSASRLKLRRSSPLARQKNTSQDAQKGRSARPQRAKRRGGTYRTSCGPFAIIIGLGERKSPRQRFRSPRNSYSTLSPERSENDADAFFQHPAGASVNRSHAQGLSCCPVRERPDTSWECAEGCRSSILPLASARPSHRMVRRVVMHHASCCS